ARQADPDRRQAPGRRAQPEAHPRGHAGGLGGSRLVGDAGRGPAAIAMPVVVVGITGCIAAYKACDVVRELQKRDVDVWAVMTANATRFVTPLTLETLTHHPVFTDQFVLGEGSDIRHISLADSADLLLVAPATANTL